MKQGFSPIWDEHPPSCGTCVQMVFCKAGLCPQMQKQIKLRFGIAREQFPRFLVKLGPAHRGQGSLGT